MNWFIHNWSYLFIIGYFGIHKQVIPVIKYINTKYLNTTPVNELFGHVFPSPDDPMWCKYNDSAPTRINGYWDATICSLENIKVCESLYSDSFALFINNELIYEGKKLEKYFYAISKNIAKSQKEQLELTRSELIRNCKLIS